MRQKIPALIISLLAAIFVANAINRAMPGEVQKPGNGKNDLSGVALKTTRPDK
jgi:hypothetical protein